ncbi:hypothetical protein CICLE_v10023758mg, partial [Citrus x clementina]
SHPPSHLPLKPVQSSSISSSYGASDQPESASASQIVFTSTMSYYYAGCADYQEPHFLDSCFLCRKPLGYNSDIFMYRGNTPFCSKECRQEQIEMDEAKERSWKKSSSSSARKSESNNSTPSKTVRTGTVAVA